MVGAVAQNRKTIFDPKNFTAPCSTDLGASSMISIYRQRLGTSMIFVSLWGVRWGGGIWVVGIYCGKLLMESVPIDLPRGNFSTFSNLQPIWDLCTSCIFTAIS